MNGRARLARAAILLLAAALLIGGPACGRKAKPEPLQGRLGASGIPAASR